MLFWQFEQAKVQNATSVGFPFRDSQVTGFPSAVFSQGPAANFGARSVSTAGASLNCARLGAAINTPRAPTATKSSIRGRVIPRKVKWGQISFKNFPHR